MMKNLLRLACLLLLSGLATPALADHHEAGAEAPRPVDVYLLAGQSNMQGAGRISELPRSWRSNDPGVSICNRNRGWSQLDVGENRRDGGFGPEIGFARTLRANDPDTQVYIIKFALSGQPLDAGWDGGSADGSSWVGPEPAPNRGTFYPGTSADDPNVGRFYTDMLTHTQTAMQALRDRGLEPHLRGIAWLQGEQDAKNEVSAGRYDQTLALLKSRLESDLGSGPVPFVFGQVLPHSPPMARFTHRDLLRQRMAEVDWRSGSERATPGIWMVPTEGMPLREDTVHYNSYGQMLMGQAFGIAMLQGRAQAEMDQ